MRNITVSVPDDVYTAARMYAARHNTSVSAVVGQFLFSLRTVARKRGGLTPGAAADLHCDLLNNSAEGAPRTAREMIKGAKSLFGG
jgi:hypothetical protein